MFKKLCTLLLAVALTVSMSGCSLFGDGTGNEGGKGESAIKISDKVTFENPEDVEFDTRYVLYNGPDTEMIKSGADYGLKEQYMIYYAKDEVLVAGYSFLVCNTEEDAKSVIKLYESQGSVLTASEEDATVLCSSQGKDELEATVVLYQSYGMIEDTKAQTYIDFIVPSFGATLLD